MGHFAPAFFLSVSKWLDARLNQGYRRVQLLLVCLLVAAGTLVAQTPGRIAADADLSQTVMLRNHHPAWANAANDAGLLTAGRALEHLTLVLQRSDEQERAFQAFLASQQDRSSPEYHHWLTPAEIGARYGLSSRDIATVSGWLQAQGLHVNWVAPSGVFIGFGGTAADVSRAFQTEIHAYTVRGAERISVASDPRIPAALAPVIKAVHGLYTVEDEPQGVGRAVASDSPEFNSNSGKHYLTPADFATIYNLPAVPDGPAPTIGIVGRSRTNFSDFNNFVNRTGSDLPLPTEVVPTTFGGVDPGPAYTAPPPSGTSLGDQLEATLDVMRAGSIATNAQLLLVVATSASGGIETDAQYLVQTTPLPAQIMTISFGRCESAAGPSRVDFWDQLFQQAAGEGISVFVSSGDSGASGCDRAFETPPASPSAISPNYICSSSYATCVGGTEFNDTGNPSQYWSASNASNFSSALSYIPEGGWNEPLDSNGNPRVAASGGGMSSFVATPSWQTGTGVPAARAGRYTPDIAFSSSGHDGYFGCFGAAAGNCVPDSTGRYIFESFSGTSAAAPSMAGITALLNTNLGFAQGNLNPELYRQAASSPAAFHDTTVATSGVAHCSVSTPSMCNNSTAGTSGLSGGQAGYLVTNGYDEVTGLGSLNVANFLNSYVAPAYTPAVAILLEPATSLTTAEPLYVQFGVAKVGNHDTSGTVVLTSGSYASAAVTLTAGSGYATIPAHVLAVGTDTITATYTPDAAAAPYYTTGAAQASITVTAVAKITPTVSLQLPATSFTTAQTVVVSAQVSGGNGPDSVQNQTPTGNVALASGSYRIPGIALQNGTAAFRIPAQALAVGTDTLTVTYTPDAGSAPIYTSAGATGTVTVTAAPITTPTVTLTLSPSPANSGQTITAAVNIDAGFGNQLPTGTVVLASGSFSSGTPAPVNLGKVSIMFPAASLAIGTDTVTATYTPDAGSSAIYAGSSGSTTITITPAVPPSFTVTGTAVTVLPGAITGNGSTVTVTPVGGFTGSVALTAAISSSPTGAQDPPILTFGATSPVNITGPNAGTATLTVATTAATHAALQRPMRRDTPWSAVGGTALACVLLLGVPARRRGWRGMLGMVVLLVGLAGGLVACGGGGSTVTQGNPGTTPGTYIVIVTGASGTKSVTATVSITVQ